jgi:hypothetical protein
MDTEYSNLRMLVTDMQVVLTRHYSFDADIWLVSNGERLWKLAQGYNAQVGHVPFVHHLVTPLVLRVGADLAVESSDSSATSSYPVEVHLSGRIVTL